MFRFLSALAAVAVAPAGATAHMVFVVPTAGDGKMVPVTVVFSDTLEPDEAVLIEKVAGLKLTARFGDGKESPVELTAEKHKLTGKLAGTQPLVAYGTVDYGIFARPESKPALLRYHPKVVLAGADEKSATIGERAAVEIVPVADGGKVTFRLLAAGKPIADADVNVMKPDGKKEKVKTDKDGRTPAFTGTGQFAAYAKYAEAKAGEVEGKKYETISHYATLVVNVAAK